MNDTAEIIEVTEAEIIAEITTPTPGPTPPLLTLVGGISTKKRHHADLCFEGVSSSCCHCGMPLTDSISIQAGMGVVCRKRGGYTEEPKNADELQAMIDLAEFPELVEFLTKHYKPQGVRGLMNGLVKICSLNRKHEAFGRCCDAIQSLGFDKLASVLRETLAVVVLSENVNFPGHYVVWVKKRDFTWRWGRDVRDIPGAFQRKGIRGIIVPINDPARKQLWTAMRTHYLGYVVKTSKGAFKITPPKTATV